MIKTFSVFLVFLLALLTTVYATDTNVSIFYGWNGSTFVPVLTDASGKLQTDFNITTSVNINPKANNTNSLGSTLAMWANIYTNSIKSGSTLSLFGGSTEAITILSNGNVGIQNTTSPERLTINGNVSFTNGPKIIDDNGALKLQAGGGANGTTSSIYFLDSGGVVRGRFETNYSSDLVTNTFTDTSNTDFNTGVYNNTNTSGTGVGTNLTLNPASFTATGGTITYSGGYTIHTFTANGTFTPTGAGNVEYLVVAGGGGGGASGGGGAGGFRNGTGFAVTAQVYTITVGAGGTRSSSGSTPGKGSDSIFSTITSTGGGGGGVWVGGGASGGSGGGGSNTPAGSGNTPSTSPSQGNNGGTPAIQGGGGGGGASAVGADGPNGAGTGGAGRANPIAGSTVGQLSGGIYYLSGGGGGGNHINNCPAGPGGAGGLGGGGTGWCTSGDTSGATDGTANTGGGGGGTWFTTAGVGGSGVVIIRYLTNLTAGYQNSGNFTSRVFDANQTVTWSSIFWDNVSSLNTSIMLKTRTSANNVTFTDWMNHTTSPSSITQNSSNRYLQYQVQMNTTNTSLTPYLLNVSVNYAYSIPSSLNTYGTLYVGTTNTAAADLAEYYATGELLEAGDVVSVSNEKLTLNGKEIVTKGVLRKSQNTYDKNIFGAISTTPGLILGNYDSSEKSLLALAGRTPVKVSTENGPIDIGDYLTSSSTPGIAMKATQPGMVIGRALEMIESAGKIEVLVGAKESNFVDDISARQEQIDMLSQQNQQIRERITVLEAKIK